MQKFRYFVHLPLPSTGDWACASVNHITITMPKYLIQTKTENKLESLAAPLLAGLKCRATKKRRRIQHLSQIYGSTKHKMQQNIQKKYKNIQIQFPVRSGAINPGANYITFHSPLIYRTTNKEKLMFAIFLEQI